MRLGEVKSFAQGHTDSQRQSLWPLYLQVDLKQDALLPASLPGLTLATSVPVTAHLIEPPEMSFEMAVTPIFQMRKPRLRKGKKLTGSEAEI